MWHCVYCGHEIDTKCKVCPYCGKDVTDDETNKMFHSNVKCIKCGSTNVDYKIIKKNKSNVIFEDEEYTCQDCGKIFTDWNRLGPSFNNSPQIILSSSEKKLAKWVIILGIAAFIIISNNVKKINEENNWPRMDCSGLSETSFAQIQTEAEEYGGLDKAREKYYNNSYIFTVHIYEINGKKITNHDSEGNHAYSYIILNKAEREKLSKYKTGDTIRVCGTVKKIGWYAQMVTVENATIID